ncbi:MAG: YfgM family protein, partial [Gammaproteobacteria bacterium]
DKAREFADRLLNEYDGTAYAAFAALMLAKLDVADAKPDEAIRHLQMVLDHADQDSLKHLARLRMARILLDENKPEEALAILEVKDEGSFAASYSELRGDSYALQGKHDEARAAYKLTLGNAADQSNDTSFLQLKIDNLPGPKME